MPSTIRSTRLVFSISKLPGCDPCIETIDILSAAVA